MIEGHGELEAAPVLCNRVLRELLKVKGGWYIDEEPIRQPRSRLVDESVRSPKRPPHSEGVHKVVRLAAARQPAGILILCDADDDCAATWGPAVQPTVSGRGAAIPVIAVMASREFESWLLWGFPLAERAKAKAGDPERAPRDAKKALRLLVPGYTPTTHQLAQTRGLHLETAWAGSDSFDKLVRSLATLVGADAPARPSTRA